MCRAPIDMYFMYREEHDRIRVLADNVIFKGGATVRDVHELKYLLNGHNHGWTYRSKQKIPVQASCDMATHYCVIKLLIIRARRAVNEKRFKRFAESVLELA
eukprot:gene19616-26300_t